MSGEYYILEEIVDQDSDTNVDGKDGTQNADNNNPASSRSGKESKLHDIEKQLEMAESRCSCLKNQLDYMKQLYGVKQSETNTANTTNSAKCVTTSRISTLKKRYECKTDSEIKINENVKCNKVRVNQGIQADICSGDLELNNGECMMRHPLLIDPQPHEKPVRVTKLPTKKEALRVNKASRKLTVRIPKISTNNSSAHTITRASKKSIKKIQSNVKTSKKQRNTSKHQINTIPKATDPSAPKIVEIYHNAAIRGSDSDESINGKKTKRKGMNNTSRISQQHIPPLKINVKTHEDSARKNMICQASCTETQFSNANNISNNNSNYNEVVVPPSKECSVYSKNYTLPTIASRLKQVAKNYLSTYNFKAIPFCAAIATTPSHNIGINIQQVMNIIKTRQPIHGLSPTLTHNIVLAANKLNCTPLSTFISTITSKADYAFNKHMCPLSRTTVNYHQLEEMAKTVPDDVINEENEDIADNDPPVETTTITGPSGEIQIHNRQRILWSMENNHHKNMCTCVPQSGLELQQVVTKYQSNHTIYTNSQISGTSTRVTLKRSSRKSKRFGTSGSHTRKMKTISEQIIPHHAAEVPTPLQGKEKNLKEVLTNLHNEFESLNKKYEDFAAQANEKGDEETVTEELTKLESELNNKEEEITMVMALYKEVLALKQQIKSLKREASSRQVVTSKDNISKFENYNNPRAAFHLTKLLRQIQHYQMHYKRSGQI